MRVNQPTTKWNFTAADFMKIATCPWCGSARATQWGSDPEHFNTVECGACGLVYVNSRLKPEALQKYYERYFSQEHQAVPEAKVRDKMYQLEFDFIYRFIQSGRILDIGCSGGEFLDYFKPHNFDCYGLEVGQEAAEIAKNKYGKDKIYDIPLAEAEIPGEFDLIILRGTIEHVPDAKEMLIKAAGLLAKKRRSFLYITSTPNVDCICADVFKTNWTQHLPEEHIYHFKKELFDELLAKYGLKRVVVHHFYEETPYANVEEDILKVAEGIRLKKEGKPITFKSPAFYGNMMTLVYSNQI